MDRTRKKWEMKYFKKTVVDECQNRLYTVKAVPMNSGFRGYRRISKIIS